MDKGSFDGQQSLLRKLEQKVHEVHGLHIKLKVKTHRTFFEKLATLSDELEAPVNGCETLYASGNCIPLAVAQALGNAAGVMKVLQKRKATGGLRYLDLAKVAILGDDPNDLWSLVPSFGLNISTLGSYVIHAESGGCPHCVVAHVDEESWVTVTDGMSWCEATVSDIYSMFVDSVDRSTVVTYRVDKEPKVATKDVVKELLLLRASGRKKTGALPLPACAKPTKRCTGKKRQTEPIAIPFTAFPKPTKRYTSKVVT
jgi:hypothetical protein